MGEWYRKSGAIIDASMPKLTPNNSRSAQMMARAAGKGFLTAEDENPPESKPAQSSEPQNPASLDTSSTPEGPRFDSLVSYPEATPASEENQPETSSDDIDRKLDMIPPEPGVYLLKDKGGKVLYVGKAKSLRPRVRAYFRDGGDERFQVRFLMRRVRDFDTLVTRSEKEALILENNLQYVLVQMITAGAWTMDGSPAVACARTAR